MSRHESDDADVVAASNRLANLSVCEGDRSPLQAIPPDSPRFKATSPPHPTAADKSSFRGSLKSSGSELEYDKDTEDKVRFNKLVKKAKHLAQEGKVQEALELNRQALQIHHHEKLAKRIAKMEEYLKNYGGDDDDEEGEGGMVQLGKGTGFYLHKDLCAKLYNHQKQGVLWLWGLHKKNKGGILGDDMGLGKTIQIIGFLSGLFDMDKLKNVMIVLPVSVMINWEKEFNKWAPGIAIHSFHGTSKRERERTLDRVQRRGGVLLTTYGMVLTSWEQLTNRDGKDFVWDYVILDEGHKIKNPSKTTKAIHGVAAKHRIILTGTPIQNNLKELWTLFDYVHQGTLLGTLRTFKLEFDNPIIRARERDASAGEKRLGMEMAQSLKKIMDPYFLRRTKASVKEDEKKAGKEGNAPFKSIKMPVMTFKNDFVVWLFLSDTQLNIYRDFLELDSVKELLMSSKSPLVALNVLKKICDHPRLLSLRACHQLGMDGHEMGEDELELPSSMESAVTKIEAIEDSVLVGEAGKMCVLVTLVDRLREEGHRTLIFSQSRKMLDIMQKVLRNRGHKVMRLDGTVKGVVERDELVQKFQRNASYSVFLLTTQVGGVGLTLTAADRVIIYDPSWNPATDAQAVDRAFRIGQTKNVVIYRLITCGTVEEKIYRRQVFKDSITRQTTGNAKDPYRYFTKQELKELFQLGEPRCSNTQRQLEEMHGLDRRRDPELDDHIAFLHSLDIFGISDHDLMFSQESPDDELEEEVAPTPNMPHMPAVHAQHEDYIKHRVQKAKEQIERESSVPGSMEQRMKAGFPTTSVYSQPQNQPLMNSVPVFQPSLADNNRLMLNRPGGGVTVFQPSAADTGRQMLNRPPARPPQVIMVYPTKPIQANPQPKAAGDVINTSTGSSTSDPIDLTVDDEGAARRITSVSSQSSTSDAETAPTSGTFEEEEIMLPRIEKRKKDHSVKNTSPATDKQATAPVRSPLEEKPASPQPSEAVPHSATEAVPHSATEAVPQTETELSSSPKTHPQSPVPAQKQEQNPVTPKGQGQRVVEEELFISPNSYTPLLMMRKKRQRLSNSPMVRLEKALAESVLVADSPDIFPASGAITSPGSAAENSNDASNEIASFLAEDDLVAIEESFVEEQSESGSPADKESGSERYSSAGEDVQHSDASEDADVSIVVKPNRRRSVCRRVAVIESSEDEMDDDEDKENIRPSSPIASPGSKHHSEDEEEKENVNDAEEYEAEADEVDDEDLGNEVGEEEEGEEENTEEGTEEEEGANNSVSVYDESMTEDGEKENEEGEEQGEEQGEEEGGEEQGEEEGGEEEEEEDPYDHLKEILRDAKLFYKQKRYPEALEKCQAAQRILPDPQIEAMVEKLKGKIQAS